MKNDVTRRQLAEGVSVRWTPDLAARVRRRIDAALVRRRSQRRIAAVVLAVTAIGGLSYAFSRAPALLAPGRPVAVHAPTAVPATPVAPDRPASSSPAAPATPDAPEITRRPLPARTPAARSPTIESLFATADAARVAGRPRDAIPPLTAILTRFPSDPRAAIAAFQLGRIHADDLDDPVAAAAAFSRALELDPNGPLARDAETRAREALERAGSRRP